MALKAQLVALHRYNRGHGFESRSILIFFRLAFRNCSFFYLIDLNTTGTTNALFLISFHFLLSRIRDHIFGTASYLLSALASYLLMLVVATYDVWLFASIVSGAAFGYFLSNPLYTWYSSIEFRNSETDCQKNNNNRSERPAHRISTL